MNDDGIDVATGPAPLADVMAADWAAALAPVEADIHAMGEFLRGELRQGYQYLPAGGHVLRAFQRPLAEVKVLIVGQDPYPTPGHSMGLAFSVERQVRPVPRSLNNMYKELHADLGIEPAAHGDLSAWSDQGVLLLNRVLTVRPGEAGSHRRKGWEAITEAAIRTLVARRQPLVAILWGRDARNLTPLLGQTPRIESAHPSPLSASRGFFGSRPFSRANELLQAQGTGPVDWRLG
ncbi:uracil-DNA glycosylase [Arthrobacter castelli]|uniref:uracil-DNA glycosylase n=1 Tax=Arthrobacter castelli TaxID=271431 RepID=UPI00040A1266|nr:uracil-DNA glycosylase [Arthrobacter castelli]